jgi:hypothetical protein
MALSKRTGAVGRAGSLLGGWALLAAVSAGCNAKPIYPVRGRIVDPEGKAITGLKGGAVEFEAVDVKASANGPIEEDGTFRLTTERPGDGAHLGRHRVAITRPYFGPEKPAPYVIDPKYERFDTSGLDVTVGPKDNEVRLVVGRYRGRR